MAEHAGWRSRGYLPHVDAGGVVQHIVFRLADSLSPDAAAEMDRASASARMNLTAEALDSGWGSRTLADPEIAQLVQTALLHFDATRYRLLAWCVMPSHVHVLVEQGEGWPLAGVVHGWKSFTSNVANRVLARSGRFWAPEYFDRFMRDDSQLQATRDYIEMNPVSAGLCAAPGDWRWSSAWAPPFS